MALALFIPGACGKRNAGGAGGQPLASPPAQAELENVNGLPAVCQQYRHKLLRCLESSHYPAAARQGQRLALRQMLAIVTQQQKDPSAGDLSAATDNCRDSLSTLEQSAKVTCPEVF